ncbi:MAG: NusA-like transcription termination signal-binding factor [Methanocorpusculum sp.]|nr:NusA-like transcription termination signal-binding factor [Methanocorpusculum sp.]
MQENTGELSSGPGMLPDWDVLERSLGFKERRYIEELRILTRSTALDCIIDDRYARIIYIIKKGGMGLAIGKNGENIRRLSNIFGKRVEMVEYDENRETFVENMFKPADVVKVSFSEGTVRIVVREKEHLGLAIGRNGTTVEKAKILIMRFFGCEIEEVTAADNTGGSTAFASVAVSKDY